MTHQPNGALPLDVKTRAFIALLCAQEVPEGRIIVLALARLDDPHALRTPQSRCQFRTNVLQSLCRGFGCEMTGALQRLVGRAGDQIREAADFPGRDQQIDQRVEIGALGRLQGPCMQVNAIGFLNKPHEICVRVLVWACLELPPGNRPGLGSTAKRGEQVTLQLGQFEVRRPGARIVATEVSAAPDPGERVLEPAGRAIQLREGEAVLWTQAYCTREGNVRIPVFLDEVYGAWTPPQ